MNKKTKAQTILDAITSGYRNRNDYPPYAVAPWDDRNRFLQYIENVLIDLERKRKL